MARSCQAFLGSEEAKSSQSGCSRGTRHMFALLVCQRNLVPFQSFRIEIHSSTMCRQAFAGRHHGPSEAEDITIQEWIINGSYQQCHMWRMKHLQILQSCCKTGPLLPIFEMQRSMGYVWVGQEPPKQT